MRARRLALALTLALTALAVAGCTHNPQPTSATTMGIPSPSTSAGTGSPTPDKSPSSPTTSPVGPPNPLGSFDGQAAYAAVRDFVTHADGSPRYRIPGTPSHDEAAAWLAERLARPGWTVGHQDFTGQDYDSWPKGSVATYAKPGSPSCSEPDHATMLTMTFRNVFAFLPAAQPTNHTMLFAAHWDSQPRSDLEVDATKKAMPDPAANDGGSGVGVLLHLVEHLSSLPTAQRPSVNVGVLFTDGEDGYMACYPVAGAIAFMQNTTTRAFAQRLLLLDMVGDADARYARDLESRRIDPTLVDMVWRHGKTNAPGAFVQGSVTISDDHVPFIEAGIPGVDLIDAGRLNTTYGFPPQWDTTDDTMRHIDAGMLGAIGQTLLDVLADKELEKSWKP